MRRSKKLALQEAQLQLAVLRQGGDADAALKPVYATADLLGLARDIPAAELRALLLPSYTATEDGVSELALQRSVVVRDALMR